LQGARRALGGQRPVLSGPDAHTYVTGPWHFDTINRYQPEGFEFTGLALARPPQARPRSGMYTYGDGWIIPKGSKDPAAAWDIIST